MLTPPIRPRLLVDRAVRWAGMPVPRYFLAIVCSGAIFLASSRSSLPISTPYGLDKLLHFLSYFVLGWSYLNVATGGFSILSRNRILIGWVAALAFAFSDEWHQSFVPKRIPDVWDLLADMGGITAALLLTAWLLPRWKKP